MGRNFKNGWNGGLAGVVDVLVFVVLGIMDAVVVTDGPAVILGGGVLARADNVDFIGRNVVAEEIAAHFGGPEVASGGVDGHEGSIAQTSCEDVGIIAVGVGLHDGGIAGIGFFADIACGADRDIKFAGVIKDEAAAAVIATGLRQFKKFAVEGGYKVSFVPVVAQDPAGLSDK